MSDYSIHATKMLSLVEVAIQYASINEKQKLLWVLDQLKLSLANSIDTAGHKLPNVIFCNLVCSGSSGIDPIIKELLSQRGYFVDSHGPEATNQLKSDVIGKHEPFYHWTHDPLATFIDISDLHNYKFIFLHRDLRDVAVSWAHDFTKSLPEMSFRDVLIMVISHNLPPHADAACTWVASGKALVITFEEFKVNCLNLICKIFIYLNIDFGNSGIDLFSRIESAVDQYSYEKVSGRKRGEEGPLIRTGYMLRKGVSGDWENYFDPEIKSLFKRHLGRQLIELGYEDGDNW